MRPTPILLLSAILLIATGIATLFAPDEIAVVLAKAGQTTGGTIVQLLGGALFALGLLDWMNRFATVGGIYGRPVVLANFAFFFISATTIARLVMRTGGREMAGAGSGAGLAAWGALAISALLAFAYGRLFFTAPRRDRP
jgi:hypothetical protein